MTTTPVADESQDDGQTDQEPRIGGGDCWDLAGRDVVPDFLATGAPSDVGSALLLALLQSENEPWNPPYDPVRIALGIRKKQVLPEYEDQAASRIRTWMVFFRGLGLVYEADGSLHVTELGRQLRHVLDSTYAATNDFAKEVSRGSRLQIARVVGPALARYQLRTPFNRESYSAEVDIHPLWAIWKAARSLDNRIHWDELDRTLTKCLRAEDLEQTIEIIRAARDETDFDPNDPAVLDNLLGPRLPVVGGTASNQQDRVIVWLQRAGFRDLFLERTNRTDGYRYLNEEFLPLLDELLATRPDDFDAAGDARAYVEWLGAASPLAANVTESPFAGTQLLRRVVDRAREFGQSRIIALVGAAGTGKTALAHEVAKVLTDSDDTRIEVVQFHAAFTYEEFIGGLAPQDGTFVPAEGILVEFNDRAQRRPASSHVLVIDEVSRADTANVLGELLTYIEYRDRSFRVPALGRKISLAPNLIVIATMNPADRSVVNMDDALVRRLRQIPVPRSTTALKSILSGAGMVDELLERVAQWFDGLPDDAPFGHGLFVGVASEADLHHLWHEQLVYFVRRGGITMYPDPTAIEDGYVWRRPEFAATASGEEEAVKGSPEQVLNPSEAP